MKYIKNLREKLQNKKFNSWLGLYLYRLVFTQMYKLLTCGVLVVIFALLANVNNEYWSKLFENIMFISMIYPIYLLLRMTLYAFILNPIKSLLSKK